MPTYEYECEGCGHRFDEFQSFKDEPLKKCPACGKETLRRLFGTGAAILFKGSGFYETDYRSESYKKAAKADQDSSSAASSKPAPAADAGSTGGTSTPAPKTDAKPSPPSK
jgi:putative FmdB family regulatory protein